jgi:hypothetical protein
MIVALCSARKAPCSAEISLLQSKITGNWKIIWPETVKNKVVYIKILKIKKIITGNSNFQNRQIRTKFPPILGSKWALKMHNLAAGAILKPEFI